MKPRPCHPLARLARGCCLLAACAAGSAHAQSSPPAPSKERWLVVPVWVADAPSDAAQSDAALAFARALADSGQAVTPGASAAALFETNHSSEPVQLDDDEMTRLLRRVGEAARHLALGELVQAQQSMEGVYALSGPARDFLNREAARARKIFDNCLMASYLWERSNDHPRALKQMLDCSRSFPGFRPEGRAYPPELREIFDQAAQQLGQMQSTTLLVRSGQRPGCGVRLNGIEVGKSPMSFSDVRSGATRVQLECEPGVPGRIHEIELHPGDNHLLIDPDFDGVVHTRGSLWLRYASDDERKARADADIRVIARVLQAERVVPLWISADAATPNAEKVDVRMWTAGASRQVASLSFDHGSGFAPQPLAAALYELSHPPVPPPPSAAALAEAPASTTPASSSAEGPAGEPLRDEALADVTHPYAGAALAILGAGGLAAGWVLYSEREALRRPLYEDGIAVSTLDAFYNRGSSALVATGLGASLFALSDYFWLPSEAGVPAWSWGVGVAGLALAGTGLGFTAFGTHCGIADPHVVCQAFTSDAHFGPLLAMQSLPILAVPLTYLVRRAVRAPSAQLQVQAQALAGGAGLTLGGQF